MVLFPFYKAKLPSIWFRVVLDTDPINSQDNIPIHSRIRQLQQQTVSSIYPSDLNTKFCIVVYFKVMMFKRLKTTPDLNLPVETKVKSSHSDKSPSNSTRPPSFLKSSFSRINNFIPSKYSSCDMISRYLINPIIFLQIYSSLSMHLKIYHVLIKVTLDASLKKKIVQ